MKYLGILIFFYLLLYFEQIKLIEKFEVFKPSKKIIINVIIESGQ